MANKNETEIEKHFKEIPRTTYFLSWCKKNKVKSICDITPEILEKVVSLQGIGGITQRRIIERYNELSQTIINKSIELPDLHYDKSSSLNEYPFEFINDDFNKLHIDKLKYFKIPLRCIEYFSMLKVSTVGELKTLSEESIMEIILPSRYRMCLEELKKLESELSIFIRKLIEDTKSINRYSVLAYRASGKTFEEIGEICGISKQRINQIDNKLTKTLLIKFHPMIFALMDIEDKLVLDIDFLKNYFDDDEFIDILIYILKKSSKLIYLDYADSFIINNGQTDKINDVFTNIMNGLKDDSFNIEEDMKIVVQALKKEDLDNIYINLFIKFLEFNSYNNYGKYLIRGNKVKDLILKDILKNYFANGINLYDEESLNKIREIIKNQYKFNEFKISNKMLIERLQGLLLTFDEECFILPDSIIDESVLNEIVSYIKKSSKDKIFYKEIFDKYENLLLNNSNVKNEKHLYSVIKYYYGDSFNCQEGYIRKYGDSTTVSMEEIDYAFSQNIHGIKKGELNEIFPGVKLATILECLQKNPKIIKWDIGSFNSIDNLNISEQEVDIIDSRLKKVINEFEGKCSQKQLYNDLLKNAPDLINSNKIMNSHNLFFIVQYYFHDKYTFKGSIIIDERLYNYFY